MHHGRNLELLTPAECAHAPRMQAVSDAAAGGMVLLSEEAYVRLPMERLWDKAMVMHVGEYELTDQLPIMDLYQARDPSIFDRWSQL